MSDPATWRPPRTPIGNFQINHGTVAQRFAAVKSLWTETDRPPSEKLKALFGWSTLKRDGSVDDWGSRFSDLYYTKLDIGQDYDWFFVHALGKGGYGAVALFEKTPAEDNHKLDEIVVKTTKARSFLAVSSDRVDLAKEAALMGQTNDLGEDGHLALRNYKHYDEDEQWRFYFEYCPYGDLERLRIRYKAYGRYLPELFLWHVLYWLSKTVYEYSKARTWRHTDSARWGRTVSDGYLTHFDIKPQNILLGPSDPELTDDVNLYPIPRMADLGLAIILRKNRHNYAGRLIRGTTRWRAPEFHFEHIDPGNDFFPFGPDYIHHDRTSPLRKAYHPITSKSNLWAIGAVMFSLLTLKESDFLHRRVISILEETSPAPRGPDDSIIDDSDWHTLPGQYYSQALRDLIKKCVRLDPNHRPREKDLWEEVEDGYDTFLRTLRNKGYGSRRPGFPSLQDAVATDPEYRLYFDGNSIDNAPDNYQFDHPDRDDSWWTYLFVTDLLWVPPEWGRLWPRDMPDNVQVPRHWPTLAKLAFDRLLDDVIRARGNVAAARPDEELTTERQSQQGIPPGASNMDDAGNAPFPGQFQNIQDVPPPPPPPSMPAPEDAADGGDSSSGMSIDSPAIARGPIRTRRPTNRFAPYFIQRRGGQR